MPTVILSHAANTHGLMPCSVSMTTGLSLWVVVEWLRHGITQACQKLAAHG